MTVGGTGVGEVLAQCMVVTTLLTVPAILTIDNEYFISSRTQRDALDVGIGAGSARIHGLELE